MSTETQTPQIRTLVRKDPDQPEHRFREVLEDGLASVFDSEVIIDYDLKLTEGLSDGDPVTSPSEISRMPPKD